MAARKKVLSEALSRLSIEINDLKHNRITYDQNVIALKEAIEQEFRTRGIASEVRIFADLLEISDSRWQNAVEGYLNTQRFHIIVEPQYYDIAADVYDRNKAKIHTTAIVNTAELCFDFGLLNGFRHWYVLQHWDEFEDQNKPFISYMEFDRHFEGDI
ncbi:hypothetical protein [uncultured Ruminococcus sp.]|uniref:hypothetical protein n=1 Tax=uncultured Ruminococcus sp. TaxID=165186 RepID=UPI0025F651A2|nr:hypothetical protein [uncultured Ruminococcus sp.]